MAVYQAYICDILVWSFGIQSLSLTERFTDYNIHHTPVHWTAAKTTIVAS